MRRWIALAARLYPRSWRERYGDEFAALIEDAPADWRQLYNVTYGALAMQADSANLKILGVAALAGALVSAGISLRVPPRYFSSAVVRIAPEVAAGQRVAPEVLERAAFDRADFLRGSALGMQAILRGIHSNAQLERYLSVYEPPRAEVWRSVAQTIRAGGGIETWPVSEANGITLRVSVAHSDRSRAQAVLESLLALWARDNAMFEKTRHDNWAMLRLAMAHDWHGDPGPEQDPITVRLDRLEAASLPSAFAERRRTLLVAAGTATGLLLGVLRLIFRRRLRFALSLAAYGLAGCVVAGGVSLLLSEHYTAYVTLRLTAPSDPLEVSGAVQPTSLRLLAQTVRDEVLDGDTFWEALKTKTKLDPAIVASLHRKCGRLFQVRSPDSGARLGADFEVTFTGTDPSEASRILGAFAAAFSERFFIDQYQGEQDARMRFVRASGAAGRFAVGGLSDAAVPTHYRLELTLAGALLGIVLALFRRPAHYTSVNGESSVA